jgi:hypothetical protein
MRTWAAVFDRSFRNSITAVFGSQSPKMEARSGPIRHPSAIWIRIVIFFDFGLSHTFENTYFRCGSLSTGGAPERARPSPTPYL